MESELATAAFMVPVGISRATDAFSGIDSRGEHRCANGAQARTESQPSRAQCTPEPAARTARSGRWYGLTRAVSSQPLRNSTSGSADFHRASVTLAGWTLR